MARTKTTPLLPGDGEGGRATSQIGRVVVRAYKEASKAIHGYDGGWVLRSHMATYLGDLNPHTLSGLLGASSGIFVAKPAGDVATPFQNLTLSPFQKKLYKLRATAAADDFNNDQENTDVNEARAVASEARVLVGTAGQPLTLTLRPPSRNRKRRANLRDAPQVNAATAAENLKNTPPVPGQDPDAAPDMGAPAPPATAADLATAGLQAAKARRSGAGHLSPYPRLRVGGDAGDGAGVDQATGSKTPPLQETAARMDATPKAGVAALAPQPAPNAGTAQVQEPQKIKLMLFFQMLRAATRDIEASKKKCEECLSEIAELDEKDRAAEAEKQLRAKRRRELEDMRNAQTEGRKRLRGELDKLRAALDD